MESNPREEEGKLLRCLQWITLKLRLTDKGATPPNWKYILLVFICLFSSSMSLTFLFPFLPEMILHFGYAENEKGTYGGLIASSVFFGRIFSSVFWGWLADVKGRKIVLLFSILLTGIAAGGFGLSVNIPMAMILRFLCGFFNGIVGTAKAVLYDVSDNSNQAVSMSMLSLAWGSGMVVGPLLGGVFATPCTKWPGFCSQESVFGQYPFLLPSLFPFIFSLMVFPVIWFYFDETLVPSHTSKTQFVVEATADDEKVNCHHNSISNGHGLHEHQKNSLLDDHNIPRDKGSLFMAPSIISLNPEAEMSVCLAKEVLEREAGTDDSLLPLHHKTTSVPNLATADVYPPLHAYNPLHSCLLSKSANHLSTSAQKSSDSPLFPKACNSIKIENNGIHANNLPSQGPVVSAQPSCLSQTLVDTDQTTSEPLLTSQAVEQEVVCECCEACCQSPCCKPCLGTSMHQLLRLKDVWGSVMLYAVLSFSTIGIEDIFPVFASTRVDYGGLGFSTNEIGMSIGFVTLPLLVIQIKLYPFLVSKLSVRKAFMLMVFVAMILCQLMPTLRALNNHSEWLWVYLVVIQLPFKIAVNCCFASTSLLINNSATPQLAGQANGLGMTSSAIARTLAPIVSGSLFAWTVTYGQAIGPPFDTGFVFFILGILYGVCLIECLFISTRLDKQKK